MVIQVRKNGLKRIPVVGTGQIPGCGTYFEEISLICSVWKRNSPCYLINHKIKSLCLSDFFSCSIPVSRSSCVIGHHIPIFVYLCDIPPLLPGRKMLVEFIMFVASILSCLPRKFKSLHLRLSPFGKLPPNF